MWFAGGGWCRRLCSRPSRSRSLSSIRRPPSSTLFPYRRSSDLATGEARYLEIAEDLVRLLDRDFADSGSAGYFDAAATRSEEHTSELQSHSDLVCRLLLEKKTAESAAGPARPAGETGQGAVAKR